ncbi:tyrosine-type recombinase/integrase [Bacillus altitudinis]|uniref:tyrosine-type recombinase/integrase n=1 Tax=Bacillus altitudinis TaxID=293387 RepID=UPI00312CC0DF
MAAQARMPTDYSGRSSHRSIWRDVNKVINIAVSTYTLRKTFGYQLYSKGINITRIMKVFGHSSEAQTLKYIGITADEIDAAYEAIEI